jgi:serine/threonine protein kinase
MWSDPALPQNVKARAVRRPHPGGRMSDQQPEAQRYEQAKAILHKALDLTPGERAAYLDAACGADAELRAEVRSLLDAHEAAGSRFLKGPIARPETETDSVDDDLDLTGQRVGAYRLERLIRRGGMGAVYLAARDDGEFTKHVAIKFIRPSIVTPALLKRFKVERQILADFDHPGIARLIDGGTTEHGMPFFIMEYVQGEALDDVLLRGPLPQPRAIQLAVSVAEVLEAVHSKGLVYRDLKPSNIMLVRESGVKILDFGIAKIMQGEAGEDRTLTEPGWIVGSPPYMSPEQASGGRIDARSDVFSYGVVIFEALTGHLPFSGDAREDYIRNLITAEPEALPPSVPARLRLVVDRCLKKSPAERFGSGGELAYAVRAAVAPETDRRPRNRAAWAAVAALALVVGALVVVALRPKAPLAPLLTGPPKLVATWASNETQPKISPDLRWVSFNSDRGGASKLWVLDRTSGAERSIEPAGGELQSHEWSPSSDRIAYVADFGANTNLVITPIAERKSLTFELNHADAVLVRWIGDGIYYLAAGSLWRFDIPTSRSREVTTERGPLRLRGADVSADERRIVFTAIQDTISSIWLANLDGSGAVRLTKDRIAPRSLRWRNRQAREVVYVSNEGGMVDIWLLEVGSGRRHALTITDAREGEIDVSVDGTVLVYEQTREDAYLAVLDPFAKSPIVTRSTSDSLSDLLPSASASGGEVAFQRSTSLDMALGVRNATIRVSRDGFRTPSDTVGDGHGAEISPDGRWVAYLIWNAQGLAQLWIRDVQERERRPILVSEAAVRFPYVPFPLNRDRTNMVWSAQGQRLFFVAKGPGQGTEIWSAVPGPDGARVEQVTHIGDDTVVAADKEPALSDLQVSADGTRLSYLLRSDSRAVSELRVRDLTREEDESVQFSEKASFRLACSGWTQEGAVVVLRSDARRTLTDVILVRKGQAADAGRLRDIDRGSVALDPRRRTLYFTREEGAVRSLHAFSFDAPRGRQERRVYQGEPHGHAFSGLRVLPNGQLLFSFQAQREDILSNEFRK